MINLEEDLKRIDWLCFKCKRSNTYAQNLYAALCNNTFNKLNTDWSCSWRKSGDIVSKMIGSGSYLDWYCSGIDINESSEGKFIQEGEITSEISSDLLNIGWQPKYTEKNEI